MSKNTNSGKNPRAQTRSAQVLGSSKAFKTLGSTGPVNAPSSLIAHLKLSDQDAQALVQLDTEIRGLESKLGALRLIRNTYTPVGRVPPELLGKIFSSAILSRTGQTEMDQLLKFTWVSHAWRTTALGFPELWSTINDSTRGWVQQCLERSKGTPLTVDIQGNSGMSMQRDPCFQELHRIIRLEVVLPEIWIALDALKRPAPILVSFTAQHLGIPDNIFGGVCPLLTDLTLRACSFTWKPALFSNLTSLCVTHPQPPVSLNSLLSQLQKMPALTSLILEAAISPDVLGGAPPVIITNLSHVEFLETPEDVVVNAVKRIATAKSVSFVVRSFSGDIPASLLVLEALQIGHSSMRVLDSIHASSSLPNHVTFGLKSSDDQDAAQITLSLFIPCEFATSLTYIGKDRISQLQSLTIDTGEFIPYETWKHSLGVLAHLRYMELHGPAILSFSYFLMAENQQVAVTRLGSRPTVHLPFPALQTLAFKNFIQIDDELQHDMPSTLNKAFLSKRMSGQGLRKFILPIGAFPPSHLKSIREVVDEVVEEAKSVAVLDVPKPPQVPVAIQFDDWD